MVKQTNSFEKIIDIKDEFISNYRDLAHKSINLNKKMLKENKENIITTYLLFLLCFLLGVAVGGFFLW